MHASVSRSNGVSGISLGIVPQANANILQVNQAVLAEVDRLQDSLPDDLTVSTSIDFSRFIEESMREVVKVLAEALLLVLVVIFAFVGSLRATIIPALTIPVAIISAFIVMAALGYTINTLTLLGLVLAIGLVVDDAIVVLENIVRKMELGRPPLLASIEGSQEIGFAVISTTAVLVAVFVPISFMPGNIGRSVRRVRHFPGSGHCGVRPCRPDTRADADFQTVCRRRAAGPAGNFA